MPYRSVAAPVVVSRLVAVGALVLCGLPVLARAGPSTPTIGPRAPAATVAALKAEAQELIRSGVIAGARDRYRRALDRAPDDLEARFGYARTSARLQDYREGYSITDFEAIRPITFPGLEAGRAGGTDRTSSILVKATLFPRARLVPFVAYARGVESFSTAAQIRGFTTDTFAVGAELRLTPRFGLRGGYEYQDSGKNTTGRRVAQQNVNAGAYVRW